MTNNAGFDHNFYIGLGTDLLAAGNTANAVGVPAFSTGTQTFTYTVPDQSTPGLQFACTLPGHYSTMHGDVVLVATPSRRSREPAAGGAAPSAGSLRRRRLTSPASSPAP